MVVGYLENRDDVQMQLLATHFLLMKEDFAGAQKLYDKLPSNVLDLPLVKGFLGRFQLKNNQPELALENVLTAYNAKSNQRNLLLTMYTYDVLRPTDKSLQLLQQHVQQQPNDLGAKMLLAERQIGENMSEAMKTYSEALKQNPNNYIASNNLAYLYLQKGDLETAKTYGLKAVELNPSNAPSLDTLAQIYVAEKNYDEALNLYDRAITYEMKNEEIYLNYVEVLLLKDDKFLAKRKLSQRELKSQKSIERIAKMKADYSIE